MLAHVPEDRPGRTSGPAPEGAATDARRDPQRAGAALIELMRETMRDAPGVGLAAPQIGVVAPARGHRGPESPRDERGRARAEAVPFHVIVNPGLRFVSDAAARQSTISKAA